MTNVVPCLGGKQVQRLCELRWPQEIAGLTVIHRCDKPATHGGGSHWCGCGQTIEEPEQSPRG